MSYTTLRTETENGVRSIVLCRADEYNTITPALRDELARAIDEADADREVRVILLRAEGRASQRVAGFQRQLRKIVPFSEEMGRSPLSRSPQCNHAV